VIWAELKAIIVSIGPGSFTGLRVGVSYAKGAALGLNIPVVPISTLDLLTASFVASQSFEGRFMTLIPARKGESFGQMFLAQDGKVTVESEPVLVDYPTANKIAQDGVLLIGEGVVQFSEQLKSSVPTTKMIEGVVPSPVCLLRLGQQLLSSGGSFPSVSDIEPVYLKEFTVKSGIIRQ